MQGNKAQGLSMNFIILAAIGLIVFIVILVMFGTGANEANEGITDRTSCLCTNEGGKCFDTSTEASAAGFATTPIATCTSYYDCLGDSNCYMKF